MPDVPIELDACVIGGGVAGLCILDALHRQGCSTWLIESTALGTGQTIASQGIIHGGLKYALGGTSSAAARAVSAMPDRWRACLEGSAAPDLSGTPLRARDCHVWGAGGTSMAGLLGARLALRTTPTPVDPDDRPDALRGVGGRVLRIAEPVIEPAGMLSCLAGMHQDRLRLGRVGHITQREDRVEVALEDGLTISAGHVVLAAGRGNAALRTLAGMDDACMQTRPLRMVMARGDLPELNGHCIKGVAPWLTITTTADTSGRTVWQIGGAVAEDGADMTPAETVARARSDLAKALPDVPMTDVQWGTYTSVRAERAAGGDRPDDPTMLQDGRLWTIWPTKLALAPVVADDLAGQIPATGGTAVVDAADPRPLVAHPPWEEESAWTTADSAAPA